MEERAAQALARVPEWLWDGESLPVPIEDIADSVYGLLVRDVEDMTAAPGAPPLTPGQSLSGLLLAARGEIWVNADEARTWPTRRRFTIGHELGHWCLHRASGAVWCRSHAVDPPETPEAARRAYPVEESEANEFAAALLMPAHLVRRHYERLRRREGCFEQMCRVFGTSGAAMSRRLRQVV